MSGFFKRRAGGQAIAGVWLGLLIGCAVGLAWLAFVPDVDLVGAGLPGWLVFAIVAGAAFLGEYADSSIGMGFGTVLAPVLLILGYTPLQVVPCLLLAETLSGLLGGGLHHGLGNVDLRWGTQANRIMFVLILFSLAGTAVAVVLAVNLPMAWVERFIAAMIVCIGLFLLIGERRRIRYTRTRIIGLGVVAAFNKGLSGGGYGPLVTGGQLLFGVDAKSAVGTTTFTEGVVSLTGVLLYVLMAGSGIDWHLLVPVLCGSLASVPAATWTVRMLPVELLRPAMGGATLYLGLLLLASLLDG